jgi:RNA polymerase sigma-70 factor, ECF subfamily
MKVQEAMLIADRREATAGEAGKTSQEQRLVAEAKSGRAIAFGELYKLHRLRVYRAAFRVLRNHQDAEDAVQRCFQRAFINLARFREDSTFSTWVTRIVINEALMLLRQRKTTATFSGPDNDEGEIFSELNITDNAPTPEQAAAENELHAALTQAISHLRQSLQAVVLLRDLQGLTSEETARRLGLTVSAVKARIFHARRCLRRQLERKFKSARRGFLIGIRHREFVR